MATEAPPSYDETLKLIANLSPEKKEGLHDAVITGLNKPETTEKIVEDVGELAEKAAEIQLLFQQVLIALGEFSYTEVNHKDKWEAIYTDFKTLLKTSIKDATNASMLIDKFVATVIPVMEEVQDEDDEKQLKTAIKLAQDFLEDHDDSTGDSSKTGDPLDHIREMATTQSEAIDKFEKKITDFQTGFTQYVASYNDRISAQETIINNLQTDINSIRSKLMWLGIGIGSTVFAGMIIGPAVMVAFPIVGGIIIGLAIVALSTEAGVYAQWNAELNAKEKALKDAKGELEELQREQTAALALKAHLAKEKGPLLSLIANIHGFGVFWDIIVADTRKLHKILKDVSKQEPGQFTEFQTYLTRSKAYYGPIQAGLQAYITHKTFAKSTG